MSFPASQEVRFHPTKSDINSLRIESSWVVKGKISDDACETTPRDFMVSGYHYQRDAPFGLCSVIVTVKVPIMDVYNHKYIDAAIPEFDYWRFENPGWFSTGDVMRVLGPANPTSDGSTFVVFPGQDPRNSLMKTFKTDSLLRLVDPDYYEELDIIIQTIIINNKTEADILRTLEGSLILKKKEDSSSNNNNNNNPWVYHKDAVDMKKCSELFDQLVKLVDPIPHDITVYGKTGPERRLTGSYTRIPGSFGYSNSIRKTTGEWPDALQYLSEIAAKLTPPTKSNPNPTANDYDTAHLNLYRDGTDKLSYHADKDGVDDCIVSFSFYDPSAIKAGSEHIFRDFFIRPIPLKVSSANTKRVREDDEAKESPNKQKKISTTEKIKKKANEDTICINLTQGSALVMLPGMQSQFEHSVPERKRVKASRINVTLRQHHLREVKRSN